MAVWRKIDDKHAKAFVKNPKWHQVGEFWLASLGSCRYGLTDWDNWPTVIDQEGNVWSLVRWDDLLGVLDDEQQVSA